MSANSIASIKAANTIAKPSATHSARSKTAVKSPLEDAEPKKTKSASHSVSISDAGKAALQEDAAKTSSVSGKS